MSTTQTETKPKLDGKTTLRRIENTNLGREIILSHDAVPSWKPSGACRAELSVRRHKDAGWLSLCVSEYDKETNRKREAYITLDAEASAALAEFIHEHQSEGNIAKQGHVYSQRAGV